jgi:hypothetical protein
VKEIFETWLGVFFLALLMVTGVSILSAGIDARNADAAKTGYIAEIENSNFAPSVINGVLDDAEQAGYDITLDLYHSRTPGATGDLVTRDVTTADEIGDTSDVYMARVQLDFDYAFPLLKSVTPHTLIGYAR